MVSRNDHPLMHLLDEHTEVAFADILRAFDASREELLELIEWGALEPRGEARDSDESSWRFSSHALVVARRAARLRRGFELDPPGVAVALGLLERIEELQQRIRELECQLPR